MGTKRPHDSEIHPSRRPHVPLPSKKRKVNPHPHRKLEPSNHAINPLKSRIRDLKRLLSHKENLPMDVRLNHERELIDCERDLATAEREKRKTEMIGKYHMVRFFDRQKATRKLKQSKRKAKESLGTEEQERWEVEVHKAEVDVNYAQFYPLDVVYSALYPSKAGKRKRDADDGDEDGEAEKSEERLGDPKMWAKVEECMERGRLDKLRNGKLMRNLVEEGIVKEEVVRKIEKKVEKVMGKTEKKDAKVKAAKDKKAAEQKQQEKDDESDGGFFE